MAQTQIIIKKAQVHLVEEVTENTYVAPAGSGAGMFLCELGDTVFTANGQNYQPNYTRADMLKMDAVPGTVNATIQFRIPMMYSGTAGTAGKHDEVWKACGMEVTNSISTSDSYNPISTFTGVGGLPGPSYSCSVLEDGIRYAIAGAQGTFTITGKMGEIAYADVTMSGAYQAVADDAIEVAVYDGGIAPAFLGATMAMGGTTRIGVTDFSFDLGNEIAFIPDVNEATGYRGARIIDRQSSGSFNPEAVLVATVDDWGIWRTGTVGAFTTGTVGATAGQRWALTCARVVRGTPSLSSTDGIRHFEQPFTVGSLPTHVEGTNDDVAILFT